MNLKIVPYTEVDGVKTFKDSDILALYDRMVKDGTADIVFYEGTVSTKEEFLAAMKNRGTFLFILKVGDKTVGFTWLNRFENRTAHNHFVAFSEVWGKETVEIGKETLGKLIRMKNNGEYLFDLFIGYIPAWNKLAIDYALECGGKTYGVIPNAIWNHRKQKSEKAVFIYYTRGDL